MRKLVLLPESSSLHFRFLPFYYFCLFGCYSIVSCFFLSSVAVADVIETVDTIYQQAENNGIAEAICKAIDIGKMFMVPLFAIMFCIYGFRAFQGDGAKWSTFITFAIGMAAFNSAGTFLEWFMPKMGLDYGCKCAIERDIRDTNGVIKTYPTGLNYDCSMGTTDYYSLHGLSNGDIGQQAMLKREEITRLKEIVSSYENLFGEVEALATQMKQKQLEVQEYETAYQNASAICSAYNGSGILKQYEDLKSIVNTAKADVDTEQQSYDAISLEMKNINAQINELKNKIAKQESVVSIAKTNYNEAVSTLNKYKAQNNPNSDSIAIFTSIVDSSRNILQTEENNLNNYQNRLEELIGIKGGTLNTTSGLKQISQTSYDKLIYEKHVFLNAREAKKRELKKIQEQDEPFLNNLVKTYQTTSTYQQYLALQSVVTEKNNLQKTSQQEYDNLYSQLEATNKEITDMQNKIAKQEKVVKTAEEKYYEANNLLLDYQKQDNKVPERETIFIQNRDNAKTTFDEENGLLLDYQNRLEKLNIQKKGKQAVLDKDGKVIEKEIIGLEVEVADVKNQLDRAKEAYKQAVKNLEGYETKSEVLAYKNKQSELDKLIEKKTNLQQEIITLDSKYRDKNNELQHSVVKGSTQTNLVGLEADVAESKNKLDKVKEAYKQAVKNLEEYETRVEMKMYLEAKNNLSNASSNRDKSQTEYNNLLTKWQVKKPKLDSMAKSYTEAKSRIATLQIELAQLTSS